MAELADLKAWIDKGWAIFPCHSVIDGKCSCGKSLDHDGAAKHPRTYNGHKSATTDLAQVEVWWKQFPGCNWGVATGESSGIWVLDIDVRKDGQANLKTVLDEHRIQMPETYAVATGGGGWHYYFAMPSNEDIRNRVDWRPGVDIRGTGGYVVLPESNHASGGVYKVRRDVNLLHAPDRLLHLIKQSSRGGSSSLIDGLSTDDLLKGVKEGGRDDVIFRLACRLRRQLGDNRAAVTILALEASKNCDPPFAEDEALRKIDQAFLQDHSDGGDPFAVGGEDFWVRRPELMAIYTNARRRRLAPWGALGSALQRALHTVPYGICYRSEFGRAPLNTGIITVGDTGLGKGRTQRLLDDTLRFDSFAIDFDTVEVGSGEALVDSFAYVAGPNDPSGQPRGSLVWRDQNHARQVMFDEVGKLAALASRDGATVFEYIKSGLSGETIGRVLAGGKGVLLPKNQYRLGVTINVQPKVAWSLLSPAQIAGGFPGRFMWFSTQDPTVATAEKGEVEPLSIPVAAWPEDYDIKALPEMNEAHDIDTISAHLGDRDPMDGHALLARAKAAIGLMVLAGRTALTSEDWALSGKVMEHSKATRSRVLAELASEHGREEQRRARSAARTHVITDDLKRKRDVERIAARLRVFREEGVPKSAWRKRIASRERDLYEDALASMDESGSP